MVLPALTQHWLTEGQDPGSIASSKQRLLKLPNPHPLLQPFPLRLPFKFICCLNTMPGPQSVLRNEQMGGWMEGCYRLSMDLWVSPSCI